MITDKALQLPYLDLSGRRQLRSRPGRNSISSGQTSAGISVFIKTFRGADASTRLRKSIQLHEQLDAVTLRHLQFPALLDYSTDPPLIITEWAAGNPLNAASLSWVSDTRAVEALARAIAELHGQVLDPKMDLGTHISIQAKTARCAEYLTPESYARASGGVLDVWKIVHKDPEFAEAVLQAADTDADAAGRTLVHGDLRLDQVIWDQTSTCLTVVDWEELHLGEPELDIGALIGEMLFWSLLKSTAKQPASGNMFGEDLVASSARQSIVSVRSPARAFWLAYETTRTGRPLSLEAVARIAGLYILDRVIAHTAFSHELGVLMRGLLGVARVAVVTPALLATALSLDVS